MTDFPTWDFATDFTGIQAASLVAGVDPAQYEIAREKVAPVLDRISRSYELARGYYRDVYMADTSDLDPDLPNEALESIGMRRKVGQVTNRAEEVRFAEWLLEDASDFEQQRFSRTQLADWLDAIGLTSVYPFNPPMPNIKSSPLDEPLDTKERRTLLTIIAALCKDAKVPYEKPTAAAGMIQSTAAKMGVSIGLTTIKNHLKTIPDALETRMK
jgi:hypothetical protein